jgi:hypothetical protein
MKAATGEIVAYLDDDARPDPHWLTYLGATFLSTEHGGVGGPNVTHPNDGPIAECVGKPSGNPAHVLLSDREAEHIPGCNMAFRVAHLEEIGGFDTRFRAVPATTAMSAGGCGNAVNRWGLALLLWSGTTAAILYSSTGGSNVATARPSAAEGEMAGDDLMLDGEGAHDALCRADRPKAQRRGPSRVGLADLRRGVHTGACLASAAPSTRAPGAPHRSSPFISPPRMGFGRYWQRPSGTLLTVLLATLCTLGILWRRCFSFYPCSPS